MLVLKIIFLTLASCRRFIHAVLLLGLCQTVGAQTVPFANRSISLPLFGQYYLDDNPGWTPIPTLIAQMKALGATEVKITLSAGSYTSPLANLPNPNAVLNPSDDKVLALLQQIRAANLQVTLMPFINIDFDPNGNLLDTVHPQPTDFNLWMQAHTAAMVKWARIAQQAGVGRMVVISDEVQGLTYGTEHTASWLDMMAQIRSVYSGQLTSVLYTNGEYLFNDGQFSHIELVDPPVIAALDILGIGWFPSPITTTASPTLAQLAAGWRHTTNGVDTAAYFQNLHNRHNKPVWITDVAFHSFSGDNIHQDYIYNAGISLVPDQQEQANEYESLFAVLATTAGPWFMGITCDSWNRFPLDYTGTARFANSNVGENIRGKLAETTIREWFSGQRGWGGMKAAATAAGTNANVVVTANLTVSSADLGKNGNLYVAALLPNGSVYLLSNGIWTPAAGGSLPVYATGPLGSHQLSVFTNMDVRAYVGTQILVGYGIDQADLLNNAKYMPVYTIR